jgi:hypothetical protein
MKTKIRTIIAICVLGIIGSVNSSAISDTKKELANYKPEMLVFEPAMNNETLIYSAQAFSTIDIEKEFEEYLTMENLANENAMLEEVVKYSAQEFSDQDVENEIEVQANAENLPVENILSNEALIYSAKVFSDLDFENELRNRQ